MLLAQVSVSDERVVDGQQARWPAVAGDVTAGAMGRARCCAPGEGNCLERRSLRFATILQACDSPILECPLRRRAGCAVLDLAEARSSWLAQL